MSVGRRYTRITFQSAEAPRDPPTGDRPVPEVREALPEVKHGVVQRGHGPPNIPDWGVGERGTP